ncbi:MAG: hypothetical protein NWF07_05900 [Candidatus Bathyarchaeota archaeon]|nr:hypothetical protein [Candidatus Bathyarchaeota archaeon]
MSLKSKKAYRIAKYLLGKNETSQSEVSQQTGVAIGYVNEVIHQLADLDIVKVEYGNTRLLDYARLLDKISMDRPFKKLIAETIRLPTSTITDTENMINQYCFTKGIRYAFTGFSGLRNYYEYHISYPMVHVYIDDVDEIRSLEKGQGVIPVVILKPDRPDIFKESKEIQSVSVCEKIQIAIDLYSSGIGRDAAIQFYRNQLWRTVTS